MPKYKNYSAPFVERQIRAIARRNPDNVNPVDEELNACAYHQGRGRNTRRCLLGQWGFEQGFKTPEATYGTIIQVVDDIWSKQATFTPEAVDVMYSLQLQADNSRRDDLDPLPWGELL